MILSSSGCKIKFLLKVLFRISEFHTTPKLSIRFTLMKIFIASGKLMDGSAYLAEILTAFGFCFHQRCSLRQALEEANPNADVLLLPAGSETEGVEHFLRAGGNVIAILPEESIEQLAGLSRANEEETLSHLRFVQPVCPGARGEALWTHGPFRVYKTPPVTQDREIIAYGFKAHDTTPDSIGIAEYSIGTGRLVIYAYDPVRCIMRLRQGYPERANFLPPGQETPRAAFLQLPNPPADTFWRPTADLHALAFCGIVQRLMEHRTPVPVLWHLPDGAPSLLLFSGDEDAAPPSADDQEMGDLENNNAAMNLYIFPNNTSLNHEDIEAFNQRGHTVSVHPYLSDTAGQDAEIQIAAAKREVLLFQERFNWPVHTVRNHSYMWPGYLEIPELWEKLGIGMDCNTTSVMRGDSPEWGPFAKLNAAMPMRFVREDGSLIDVFQQPTQINDDLMFHPTSEKSLKLSVAEADVVLKRILNDAIWIDHSPICVNFHPGNYVNFSAAPALALLQRAKKYLLPVWSLDRWHQFWRKRDSWKMKLFEEDESSFNFTLQGDSCEGLSLLLPLQWNQQSLRKVLLNGRQYEYAVVNRRGCKKALLLFPPDCERVELKVEYK